MVRNLKKEKRRKKWWGCNLGSKVTKILWVLQQN